MEEKEIREQPEENVSNVQDVIVENEENGTTLDIEPSSGSLGKFKDAENVLKAYNNLQAEFTKKCQKLSEVSKRLEDLESLQQKQKAEHVPVYKNGEWKQSVSAFLTQNSEAKEYAEDICNEILKDEKLQSSADALELAWARVMKKEYASPKSLASDDNFINNQIINQEQVRQRVLNEYFTNIQKTKTPPVIAGSGVVTSSYAKEPTTMQEAKQMVEKLFNLKG